MNELVNNFDYKKSYDFIERHYLKNRTIVSSDIHSILHDIEKTIGLEGKVLRYPSGNEYETWIVPKQWDVREAWLKDSKGKIVASYGENPLFVAPYSTSVNIHLTKDDLLEKVYFSEKQPDAFAYNHRLAFDLDKQLKDWCISIPYNRLRLLQKDNYHLYIDVEEKDGEMLIGEWTLRGESNLTFVMVADFCHPGQVNDSFSGVALFMEVMRALSKIKNRKYTYKLVILPETIGSCIYLSTPQSQRENIFGAIFSDNVGWGEDWFFQSTRKGDSYLDKIVENITYLHPNIQTSPFGTLIGNDEHIFDSPQVSIPTLSLQKYFYDEYHTSFDNIEKLEESDLRFGFEILMNFIEILENNKQYKYVHKVPFYMSRYKLYADYYNDNEEYTRRKTILNLMEDHSVLDIANKLKEPFQRVRDYICKLEENNLIKEKAR